MCRDILGITDFHGAGCEKLTLKEMYRVMGHNFWTQITPHELRFFTPAQIEEKIRLFADSGASTVQLYPGRGTPERNMAAAVASVMRRLCSGGPRI